jgi:hypothetical protein
MDVVVFNESAVIGSKTGDVNVILANVVLANVERQPIDDHVPHQLEKLWCSQVGSKPWHGVPGSRLNFP